MRKRGTIFAAKNKRLLAHANALGGRRQREIIRIYIFAVVLGLIPITITAFTITALRQPLFLLLIPFVTTSTWYGNIKTGMVTTVIATLGISYITLRLFAPLLLNFSLIELFLTVASCVFVAYIIDISKKTREIDAYKQREKKYADLLVQLEKEHEKAKKEIKARDEFLSIASHELKTPLTSMLLQLQTALHNIKNVSLANFSVQSLLRMIENAEQQSQRLTTMINDLLNVSLITTGRLNLSPSRFNITDVVKDLVERSSEELKQRKYAVHLFAKEPIIGKWDKIRIEQVVTNLLSNAIKYGNGKPIEIRVEKGNSHARIIFKDHGIGINKEQQKKIFERFERGVAKGEYQGLGVGLYIVSQIVKAHEGKIKLDSSLGSGSTFTVDLPIK